MPFAGQAASKWVGDCYLVAYAEYSDAVLVTFDKALLNFAGKRGKTSRMPARAAFAPQFRSYAGWTATKPVAYNKGNAP